MSWGYRSPSPSVAWSKSAAPEDMEVVVPRGAAPGDVVSAQAPSGRVVMVRIPPGGNRGSAPNVKKIVHFQCPAAPSAGGG